MLTETGARIVQSDTYVVLNKRCKAAKDENKRKKQIIEWIKWRKT